MKNGFFFAAVLLFLLVTPMQAQQPQIPTLQVCNQTTVNGGGLVKIVRRADAGHSGTFKVEVELRCDPSGYPAGTVRITSLSMSDSIVQGNITSTLIEQVTSTGKHTPTAYINGRCNAQGPAGAAPITGCRFWIMFADNKLQTEQQTADVVSFLVFDGTGKRVAYGTGPVVEGDIRVGATGN
jgi:hypothetical protein